MSIKYMYIYHLNETGTIHSRDIINESPVRNKQGSLLYLSLLIAHSSFHDVSLTMESHHPAPSPCLSVVSGIHSFP